MKNKQSFSTWSYAFLLLGAALFLNACSCVPGTGEIVSQEVDLDVLNSIENNSSVDVELRFGPNQRVEFTGHENHLALLNKSISRDHWVVDFAENVCTDDISIVVTLPLIEYVEVDGSGSIIMSTPFHAEEFEAIIDGSGDIQGHVNAEFVSLDLDGSGSMTFEGYTDKLEASLDGSGEIEAKELKAKEVEFSLSGSGSARIYAEDLLDISLSGSGSIRYAGDPAEKKFNLSGSGSANPD